MSIGELQRLLPPPSVPTHVPRASHWRDAEAALGTGLPQDYKDYLSLYGSGRIGGFMEIGNPASPDQHNELVHYWREQQAVFRHMERDGTSLRYQLHPARPGLLPLGRTDNGDEIFYVTDGAPEHWKIGVLESRGEDVDVFDGGLTSFLCAALSRRVLAFPSGFPRDRPAFVSRK